jgi:tetratricopeptide (TPR) repeat protein
MSASVGQKSVGIEVSVPVPQDVTPEKANGTTRRVALSTPSLLGLLALGAVLPYLNTLANSFVYDDNRQVLNNPYLYNASHLREIFTTSVWSYMGPQYVTNYYRPMMTLGYLVCYRVFGPLAYGFHLVNLLLHAGVICLLFLVTERLLRSRHLAIAAAMIFALHPIHTESVAWIAAVTDLELAFFSLLAFWIFLTPPRADGAWPVWTVPALAMSFVLALLSKEPALTLPPLATVYEHACRDDRQYTSIHRKVSRYGILWAIAFAYAAFRLCYLGGMAPVLHQAGMTWYQAALSGVALLGQYVAKLLWPVSLCAFYVFRRSTSLADPRVLAGLLVLALLALITAKLWHRERRAAFGVLWLLLTLAPVLNARWMAANVFTERYLYLPSVGFCWVMAWAGTLAWRRLAGPGITHGAIPSSSPAFPAHGWQQVRPAPEALRRTLTVLAFLVASLCALRIWMRNSDWQNDVTLYTRTLTQAPDAIPMRTNLGAVYWGEGDAASAEREWRMVLKQNPNDFIALNDLGLVAMRQKHYAEAAAFFQRSMRLRPSFEDAHVNLGVLYLETGLPRSAELQLRAAAALSPLDTRAHTALGRLCAETGRLREAAHEFRLSLASQPTVQAYDGLGDVESRLGHRAQAKEAYTQAIVLANEDSHAHFGLAALYEQEGQEAMAVREYQLGLQTDPNNANALAALHRLTAPTRHDDARQPGRSSAAGNH